MSSQPHILVIDSGHRCSLQYHQYKLETIVVLSGELYIEVGEDIDELTTVCLHRGEVITIKPGIIHRMLAKEISTLYLECSTNFLEDVVRLEDDYKRI